MFEESKQAHYEEGRSITEINRSDIYGVCNCGYLTLKGRDAFEDRNGGLTVKRNLVTIYDDNGNVVKRLHPLPYGIMSCFSCNACVNDWR